jgi:hypothetical protein
MDPPQGPRKGGILAAHTISGTGGDRDVAVPIDVRSMDAE